ncbi:TPA: tail fiber assembly protein, partial [Escherichia coli]|nr:tail fiber assembly protein [Escherichia coli]
DAGDATDEEIVDLSAWKKYRVALMRMSPFDPGLLQMPE